MTTLNREQIELTASDGAHLSAYHVSPPGRVRAGLVVLQEIFGVNAHIRSVADRFAEQGYEVIAPALFDRIERHVELGYDDEGRAKGRTFPGQLGFDKPLLDIAAAVAQLRPKAVGVVGYCWGGSLAYLSATRVEGIAAAVGYYGSAIAKHAEERPRVPVQLHFGEHDKGIPLSDVSQIQKLRPEVDVRLYPAEHGFNCDVRASYSKDNAQLALSRTLSFFEEHLG